MNESTLVPREEMSDLDWLARNVHVWPTNTPHIVPAGDCVFEFGATFYEHHVCIYLREFRESKVIYKKQWLSRRAELQNKPSWNVAPEWAMWLCQFVTGEWMWFASRPIPNCMGGWGVAFDPRRNELASDGRLISDFCDTLEKRPEQAEFEPFASVEDEPQVLSELEMLAKVSHLISDKRHRITPSKYTKTIHGVSVDVYDVLQAWGVSNQALQHLIKKALQCGQRGHKDNAQDLQDIIDSAIRAKELES